MMDRNCYTYFLKWNDGTMYYGCRYARGCDPSDLWNTYFTSSRYIPREEPKIKKIAKVFGEDIKKCREHESRFLKKVNAAKSDKWHNKTDIDNFYHSGYHTEETKEKIKQKRKNQTLTDERNKKVSESLKGRSLSEEHKRKISISTKGRTGGRLGKKASDETRLKMSQSSIGKTCPSKGTKWWNNGVKNKRSKSSPGIEYVEGFLHQRTKQPDTKNLKWWINDKGERKRSKTCPGENWKRGMK